MHFFKTERVYWVDLLVIIFGISSWISINGFWVELSQLVYKVPEGWKLPSYISVIVQIANIGPLFIGLIHQIVNHKIAISVLLVVGVLASFALTQLWTWTISINGTVYSAGLFLCIFLLSLVDCTSSVLYLPFMASLKEIYLNSLLIGEGLSGFLPALIASGQGLSSTVCNNHTLVTADPNFSVDTFFYILFALMVSSFLAFILLLVSPNIKKEFTSFENLVASKQEFGIENEEKEMEKEKKSETLEMEETKSSSLKESPLILYGILAIVCCLSNGALPSIQTYSCLPYGNLIYQITLIITALINPLMAFLAHFLSVPKNFVIYILFASGMLCVFFIFATALHSPNLILGFSIGGFLTISAWILYTALFTYVKVSIANVCRSVSENSLFRYGVVTQMGSAFGALTMFLIVNYGNVFLESSPETC